MLKNGDIKKFLRSQGLLVINGYKFYCQLIGGASFSAIYKRGDKKVVAKFFILTPNASLKNAARREIDNFSRASTIPLTMTPKFICEFSSGSGVVFGYLMEYVDGYDFDDVLNEANDFIGKCQIAFRVGWAVCHSLKGGVTHRDLHPGNFIFTERVADWKLGSFEDDPAVRLIDFGASVSAYHALSDGVGHSDVLTRFDGAITCVAPEYFKKGFNFLESRGYDGWALGLLFCYIFTKNIPFEISSVGSYVDDIYSGNLQRKIDAFCDERVDNFFVNWLVKQMLRVDDSERLQVYVATRFAQQLWLQDSNLLGKNSVDMLRMYALFEGCDPEFHLAPHERSDSPY